MTRLLARKIKLRTSFTLKSMPFVARFHRTVARIPSSRKSELLFTVPMGKLFAFYHRRLCSHATGELVYHGPAGDKTINYNARNLAFDMFYSDTFADNYEDETGVLMDTFLPADGCLYDIGSNFGFFGLYFASRGGKGMVHAFEPIPGTFADLTSCVKQAGLADRIHCHNLAASDQDGEVEFQLPVHSAGAHVGAGRDGVSVRTARMDSLKLDPPDFMKIDAECHEAAVLRGSEGLLREKKPFVMFENKLERNNLSQTLEPINILIRHGYQLFAPTVLRKCSQGDYLLCCGYQAPLRRNLKIEREDVLVLVPCEPISRSMLPAELNLFACHRDRMGELLQRFEELPA